MRTPPFFEPTSEPHGVDVVVMPVIDEGTVIDLIAWRSLAPDAWLWRNGDGWALGIDAIETPSHWNGHGSITLHATPLDWLRAGGSGACILSWNETSMIRKLANFDTINCACRRAATKLYDILSKPHRLPKIVRGQSNELAA